MKLRISSDLLSNLASSRIHWSGSPIGVEQRAIAKWLFNQEKATLAIARNATYSLENHFKLTAKEVVPVPKFVIEREIPGAGSLSPEQLRAISQKSCSVLSHLGPQIQWLQSYVTDNKIYCVYIAPNEQMVREHASQGGFPANSIAQVRRVIDPTTAETPA